MNDRIKATISQYEETGDFTYFKVTDGMISAAEKELNLTLPEQYKDFLKTYGHGGIGGISILGVGLDGSMVFVEETLDYRNDGLPLNLVIIENEDEWIFCIDSATEKIVSWDMSGYTKEEFDCFDDYLLAQMQDAIENL